MLHRTLKQFYNPFVWSQTLLFFYFLFFFRYTNIIFISIRKRRKTRLRINLYVHRASKRTGNYLYLASKFNFCTSKMLVKPCPTLLAVMMKIYFTIQYGSQYLHVVIKHVKCSYCDRRTKFQILVNLNFYRRMWLATIVWDIQRSR